MTRKSELLIAYGFSKKDATGKDGTVKLKLGDKILKVEGKTPEDKLKWIRDARAKYKDDELSAFEAALQDAADHQWVESTQNQVIMTDWPKHLGDTTWGSTYQISIENWHQSIETYYFWCMNFFSDVGFVIIDKVTDTFAAAEQSSAFGATGQRLGLAQDKVGQYLATIGKMVKDLFALVRELRWIDERLQIYRDAMGVDKDGKKTEKGPLQGAEIALKGMWVDLVDGVVGGQRTGSNLFNMATQLQFVALPDLFFSIHPQSRDKIDDVVKQAAGGFNEQVKNVLLRKLEQYMAWKESTFTEMKQRRRFTLDYLRQHYNSIRLYMNWIKPYIKHIQRLTGQLDLVNNARLVSSFESNLIEVEIIARAMPKGNKKVFQCVMLSFEYHSKPQMQFSADPGYHRGPLHVGTCKMTWRAYAWTQKEIDNYKAMREQEDLDLLGSIDKNLESALEQLSGDIVNYLKEAGEQVPEKPKDAEKPKKIDLTEPFSALLSGFKETFSALVPELPKSGGKKDADLTKEYRSASNGAKGMCFLHMNIFKKAHGLLSW